MLILIVWTVLGLVLGWLVSRAHNQFQDREKNMPSPIEKRTEVQIRDLLKRAPKGYRTIFVENSLGTLYLPGSWCRRSTEDGSGRWSIELVNKQNRVMAAIAWYKSARKDTLYTSGTFVSKSLRRRGLGKALWRAMLDRTGNKKISGFAVTDEGLTLLAAMKEEFPNRVSFDVDECEELEDLRPGKGKRSAA